MRDDCEVLDERPDTLMRQYWEHLGGVDASSVAVIDVITFDG
jgi:hypothetical protein